MNKKDTLIVSMISAICRKNRTIGKETGGLPWHIPEDFIFFKETTMGHPIIMGRKTFEEFPKLLPGRVHIVITRDENYIPPRPEIADQIGNKVFIVNSIENAIEKAKKLDTEIFVIGGAQIYNLALPYADKLYLTLVETDVDGPAKFPEFEKDFQKVSGRKSHDENFEYEFTIWEKLTK
jgi:dihydrofolate reductase